MPRPLAPAAGDNLWPLYAGGFLGPFGGAMVSPMLPEVQRGLDTSLAVAAANLTVYLVPFAGLMVVSGTLAERWGRRRTVQIAYLAYAAASVVCALSVTPAWFLGGRGIQGVANAFTTPILVAALADLVPEERLGRALGVFGSLQAAGLAFAPLIGGAAAAIDWRLAFWASVAASLVLALMPPQDAAGAEDAADTANVMARWRALRNRRLALACGLAALCYLTVAAMTLLGALVAADRFGLDPEHRGLVVAAFGVSGVVVGRSVGQWSERWGSRPLGVLGALGLAISAVVAGYSPWWPALVVAMLLGGAAGVATRITVNGLAVRSTPANRSGAVSLMLACQFLGGAVAPVMLIPAYSSSARTAFVLAAASSVVAAVILLAARRDQSDNAETHSPSRA